MVAAKVVGEEEENRCSQRTQCVLTDQVKDEKNWSGQRRRMEPIVSFLLAARNRTDGRGPSCAISYTINYVDHYGIDALSTTGTKWC